MASAVAAPVSAAPSAPDAAIDCVRVERDGGNGVEMNHCAAQAHRAADTALNQVYSSLRQLLDTDDRKALLAAQRAWLAWRDQEAHLCARSSGFGPDGSGYSMVWSGCATQLTTARTQALRQYLKDVRSR